MGLIVDDHGRYRGWLASFLCCCFALTDDEHPKEREGYDHSVAANKGPYYQQPNLTTLPSLPIPTHISRSTKSDIDTNSLHDSRSSDTFNLSKSLELEADCLLPRSAKSETEHNETHPPWTPLKQPKRSIQAYRETGRTRRSPSGSLSSQSLVPLPLGPVVLRDPYDSTQTTSQPAATPDYATAGGHHKRSESTQNLLGYSSHQPYFETRETPYQRCSRRSTETLAMRSIPPHRTRSPPSTMPKSTASTPSLSSSFKQYAREPNNQTMLPAVNERPITGARLQRKRSNQSHAPQTGAGDSDVEKEVLELNTIVEERRAETNKTRSRHSHVPAVAPSMQIRARSETLNDIGSALSRPLATQDANPREEPKRAKPKTSKSLVSGCLSNFTASSPSPAPIVNTTASEPFYNCASTSSPGRDTPNSSSATVLDSVASYTLESSPTVSKRYSRSLMITPLPAADEAVANDEARQVGVAL